MHTRNKIAVLTAILTLTLTLMSISTVQAAGPFDQTCPNCNGAGTISSGSTVTCSTCNGAGTITSTHTCDKCSGTGKITVTNTCSSCGGDGKVRPSIAVKSTNGYGTLSGLDWVTRCEITVQNEANVGTYFIAESKVHTITNDYYHQSARTYLEPHKDVKVTIDTKEVSWGTDNTYSIYIKSVDDITCERCQGSGGSSSVSTCDKCWGSGTVTTTDTCNNCHGTGQITTQQSLTCPTCNGNRTVTNWTTIGAMVMGIVVMAVVIGAFALHKSKKAPPPP